MTKDIKKLPVPEGVPDLKQYPLIRQYKDRYGTALVVEEDITREHPLGKLEFKATDFQPVAPPPDVEQIMEMPLSPVPWRHKVLTNLAPMMRHVETSIRDGVPIILITNDLKVYRGTSLAQVQNLFFADTKRFGAYAEALHMAEGRIPEICPNCESGKVFYIRRTFWQKLFLKKRKMICIDCCHQWI